MKDEMLTLTQEWDKTFPKSDKVDHNKVTFHNRYPALQQRDTLCCHGASR